MKKVLIALFILTIALPALSSCFLISLSHTCQGEELIMEEPTCAKEGKMFIICFICFDVMDSVDIPKDPTNHTGDKYIKYPDGEYSDNKYAYYTYACSHCNKSFADENIVYAEHNLPSTYEHDENFHWKKCADCPATSAKQLHRQDSQGKCTICKATYEYTAGIDYALSEDGSYAIVTDYHGTGSEVKIAEKYRGVPVTHIGENAFWGNKKITKLTLPSTLRHIGNRAFYYCVNMNISSLPEGLEYIDEYAFCHCEGITISHIPDSVTHIGREAFLGCKSIKDLTIGNGLNEISQGAFELCAGLSKVVIGDGVTTINPSAFRYSNIIECVISDSVESIGDNAFSECKNLEVLHIGSGLRDIGNKAFYLCKSLKEITISPENANFDVHNNILYTKNLETLILFPIGCDLKEFTIPNGVKHIGALAFSNSKLEKVVISDTVITIEKMAFYESKHLAEVAIGKGVSTIAREAFADCISLTDVHLSEGLVTIGEYAFGDCDISFLVIPDSVEAIADHAFAYNYNLTEVVMGSGIKTIGLRVFHTSHSPQPLESIYYRGTNEEWKKVKISSYNNVVCDKETIFFYSESTPDTDGDFWHYDENGNPTKW